MLNNNVKALTNIFLSGKIKQRVCEASGRREKAYGYD